METLVQPTGVPRWLAGAELRNCVDSFRETGFTGPLNWYRNLDNNWEAMKAFEGATVNHPALFIAGEDDPVLVAARANFEAMNSTVPGLRRTAVLPGCGHSVQHECPAEVNRELLAFLDTVAR